VSRPTSPRLAAVADPLLHEEGCCESDCSACAREATVHQWTVAERLLTAAQLAETLGFSASTIVDWAEAGKIPAFKIGGRLRFRASELEPWLERHRLDVA
jgi:excisionase family DNA binding protein